MNNVRKVDEGVMEAARELSQLDLILRKLGFVEFALLESSSSIYEKDE